MYIVMEMPDPDNCIAVQGEYTGSFDFQEASDLALDLSEEHMKVYGIFTLEFIANPPRNDE